MTRQLFEKTLRELTDEILIMGSMVEKAVSRSVEALRARDTSMSECVVHDDVLINRKRYEIEERCILTMGLQSPVAADLRAIVAILFIATELERIADHAEGIGRINLLLGEELMPRALGDIAEMADRACDMLRRSLSAFVARDAETARVICDEDDGIDA